MGDGHTTHGEVGSYGRWTWLEARGHFSQTDPEFHALVESLTDPGDAQERPVFESLCRAIIGQQLSTKAAATIWGRLNASHGGSLSAQGVIETDADVHRALGVSGQKHRYLQDLAHHYLKDATVFESVSHLSDEEIIASWTKVKGLGRWTVQMCLMFQLRRPDVFAPDDLGIRRAMELHLGLAKDGPRVEYEKRARIWGPFRTAACRFLWMSLENQPK